MTPAELGEALRPFVRRMVLRFWSVVVVIVVLAEFLLWYVAWSSDEKDYTISWFLLFIGILWLPIAWWLGRRAATRSADQCVLEERSVVADDAGLEIERETGHSTVPWRFLRSWRETRNLLVLDHGDETHVPVPKHA